MKGRLGTATHLDCGGMKTYYREIRHRKRLDRAARRAQEKAAAQPLTPDAQAYVDRVRATRKQITLAAPKR